MFPGRNNVLQAPCMTESDIITEGAVVVSEAESAAAAAAASWSSSDGEEQDMNMMRDGELWTEKYSPHTSVGSRSHEARRRTDSCCCCCCCCCIRPSSAYMPRSATKSSDGSCRTRRGIFLPNRSLSCRYDNSMLASMFFFIEIIWQ